MWAVLAGHNEIIEILLAAKANVNQTCEYGYTPLMWAVQGGHTESMKILLVSGANINQVNAYGMTALMCAVNMNNQKLVETLLHNNAKINKINICKNTALSLAIAKKYKTIEYIIQYTIYRRMRTTYFHIMPKDILELTISYL